MVKLFDQKRAYGFTLGILTQAKDFADYLFLIFRENSHRSNPSKRRWRQTARGGRLNQKFNNPRL
ncbi:hypothetical protein A1356_05070 [Methylomonas koyamae]|uniref:Uncharacterized protein n=1 Tax=Methylomonas koyamae TaxID=702114 RepID=A0AA91DGF2_9GAMM|nr:hypothetical protein A1356_05070 [Methylomonas koyamae]